MVVKLPNICKHGVCYPGILTITCCARNCVNIEEPLLNVSYWGVMWTIVSIAVEIPGLFLVTRALLAGGQWVFSAH